MTGAPAVDYPAEVQSFHSALARLPGAYDISSRVLSLSGVSTDDLGYSPLAQFPHAALRRTGGGLDGEMLIQTEFRLAPEAAGWRSLEFIAWFVRDQARGGENIQLRPYGLPPTAGNEIQLGHTLRFHIELFCQNAGDALTPALAAIERISHGLNLAIDLYQGALMNSDSITG